MLIKPLIIAALIKLHLATDNHFLSAGILGAVSFSMGMLFVSFSTATIYAGVVFGISAGYFWSLGKLQGSEFAWWSVCIVGVLGYTFLA